MFQLDPTLSFKTALNQQFNIVPKTKSLRHIKDTLSPLLQCHLDEFVKTFYELNSMASNHYKTKELQILWSQFLSLEATILLFSHLDNHIKNKDLSTCSKDKLHLSSSPVLTSLLGPLVSLNKNLKK